jgi:GAF domain-containing protein
VEDIDAPRRPLYAICTRVAVAIDRARLFETLEQRVGERTGELAALNHIAAAVNQSLDLDEILATALEELVGALQVRGGGFTSWIPRIANCVCAQNAEKPALFANGE